MPRRLLTLPIGSALNSRISGTNPLPASSGIIGIGIIGIMVIGQSVDPSSKDARFTNCFKRTVDRDVYAVKRSGVSSLVTTTASSVGTAITVWTGQGSGTKYITSFNAEIGRAHV